MLIKSNNGKSLAKCRWAVTLAQVLKNNIECAI
jgi:hypothetical protein